MIDVAVVDENGAVEHQLENEAALRTLNRALAEYGSDPAFCCLRFIDPYGDTTFNHIQAGTLVQELALVAERAEDANVRAAVDAVRVLADEVVSGTHLYLKFVGD